MDDLVLACLALDPKPDYCDSLELVRADFETKVETLRTDLVAHTGDTTIHSSTSSVDLPGDSESSSTDNSSSDSHSHNPWRYSFSFDSFDLSSDSSHHSYHSFSYSSKSHSLHFIDRYSKPKRRLY